MVLCGPTKSPACPSESLWSGLGHCQPEATKGGPSTQYLRCLVPKTIVLMVLETRELKYLVLGPSGQALECFNANDDPLMMKVTTGDRLRACT